MSKNLVLAACFSLLGLLVGVSLPMAHAVTVSGGTPTAVRSVVTIYADGSQSIGLNYTNTNGQLASTRTLMIDSGCSKVIDNIGNTVSSVGPSSECSAASTFTAAIDSVLAANASKLAF